MDDLTLPRPLPEKRVFLGSYVRLEPLHTDHTADLWEAAQSADASFTYLRYGPFPSIDAMRATVDELSRRAYQPFWAVRDEASGRVGGWLSLCDISPTDGAIEVGSIWISPVLQRTRQSTEAIFLLMQYAMDDLAYRRLVWRCCSKNIASMRAARRYGFIPEGIWRRAIVVKGQPMDIAWYSILEDEWDLRREAIKAWLKFDNFGPDGAALRALSTNEERAA
ncbi:N-acetyltransferase [Candidimonas sp. SYP-B2681]|uniref:GNAT family N-acetyltransferase n=1 Tax=Candidimonas sp. SYP-B2681 TaxID=2497686 RepID=UPI000F887E86|nr:GNAT family protein [Candidimonas sp. SYP-B2681]RTZ43231.1 N-acetyltransferase [Candidimonas sp. SYP-B2681]